MALQAEEGDGLFVGRAGQGSEGHGIRQLIPGSPHDDGGGQAFFCQVEG